jgi:hypothetical protein
MASDTPSPDFDFKGGGGRAPHFGRPGSGSEVRHTLAQTLKNGAFKATGALFRKSSRQVQ